MPTKQIKKINKSFMSLSDLNHKIKVAEKDRHTLLRLLFIRFCYNDKTIKKSSELIGISLGTAYNWFNLWNNGGYENIVPKFDGGRPSKLIEKNKRILKNIFIQTDNLTTEKAYKIIKDEFNISYTFKQVREILKKLGFSLSKPYPKYNKSPKNAKEILKSRTKNIDYENEIVGCLDQTACENPGHCIRTWHLKGSKNEEEYNPSHFRQTACGFQAYNGKSIVKFLENSKKYSMIQFLAEVRIANTEDVILQDYIKEQIYNENLKIKEIINEIYISKQSKNEIEDLIIDKFKENNVIINKTSIKSIAHSLKENKTNINDKIDNLIAEQIVANLKNSNLDLILSYQTKINIILDNYRPHHSRDLVKASKILNINLIYLPPYSPNLSTIEQVWKSIKRVIYSTYIPNKEFLITIFRNEYYKIVDNVSFYSKWVDTYIL